MQREAFIDMYGLNGERFTHLTETLRPIPKQEYTARDWRRQFGYLVGRFIIDPASFSSQEEGQQETLSTYAAWAQEYTQHNLGSLMRPHREYRGKNRARYASYHILNQDTTLPALQEASSTSHDIPDNYTEASLALSSMTYLLSHIKAGTYARVLEGMCPPFIHPDGMPEVTPAQQIHLYRRYAGYLAGSGSESDTALALTLAKKRESSLAHVILSPPYFENTQTNHTINSDFLLTSHDASTIIGIQTKTTRHSEKVYHPDILVMSTRKTLGNEIYIPKENGKQKLVAAPGLLGTRYFMHNSEKCYDALPPHKRAIAQKALLEMKALVPDLEDTVSNKIDTVLKLVDMHLHPSEKLRDQAS